MRPFTLQVSPLKMYRGRTEHRCSKPLPASEKSISHHRLQTISDQPAASIIYILTADGYLWVLSGSVVKLTVDVIRTDQNVIGAAVTQHKWWRHRSLRGGDIFSSSGHKSNSPHWWWLCVAVTSRSGRAFSKSLVKTSFVLFFVSIDLLAPGNPWNTPSTVTASFYRKRGGLVPDIRLQGFAILNDKSGPSKWS